MQDTPATPDLPALWPKREVLSRTGISRATIDKLEKQERFPRRIRITPFLVAWRAEEVIRWMELGPLGWQEQTARQRATGDVL